MELKVKILRWSAGIPVAMLNEDTANLIGVKTKGRIFIKTLSKNPDGISTIVDIAKTLVRKNEVAVSSELKERLNLSAGQRVDVDLSSTPKSMIFIKKKMNGKVLSQVEVNEIIKDVVDNSLSDAEIALFISSMYEKGMNMKETIYLINAILHSGKTLRLNLKHKLVADKHSIGGIPGNRTTPIIVSICAAAGLVMPKSSSRAITAPAGTADVIETIAKVEFSLKELEKIVKKTGACLIWGGSLEIVPADEKIISIEKMLNIDPEAQLLASIMSKKLASGAKYILIDIPYGKTAKVTRGKALELKKKFEYLGKHFHKILKVVLTRGDEPIGNGIGPVLEIIDIKKVLSCSKDAPQDLRKKSLFLSGELLEMTGKAKKGQGIKMAAQILDSGKALAKFKEIIKAQKGNLNHLKLAKFKKDITAARDSKIVEIDNKKINSLGRITGCPLDKSAGLYLYKHVGGKFQKGEKIITIYTESKTRMRDAIKFYSEQKPIILKNN
ncbi:MAG: thymidine phosphorylase [Candidatus Nanoarchaeia archaeon]|nr:thymidine phosphorylase [Candidatus Nanoarchaeia archaeon]MDD5357532.1 thymidine phosphorylase [Candidatus Nanoarchaeia archaeon]MDD5588451.1 thymidine phosphorylase [Candidatus Nanoarchaeia archaeon]